MLEREKIQEIIDMKLNRALNQRKHRTLRGQTGGRAVALDDPEVLQHERDSGGAWGGVVKREGV